MSKICCVSDLHLGCHGDSELWHQISLDWAEWLNKELKEKGISKIVICGDFFDNRSEIGVKTIHVANELLNILSDFKIIMINGNHDLYYKNRDDVSSISVFDKRDNIVVIKAPKLMKSDDHILQFVNFGANTAEIKKCDVLFGHFEINGFQMTKGRFSEGRTSPNDILSKAKLTFSGHFHLRDERSYKNGKIIYLGSPYQLNWGERTNVPGYYILDTKDLSYSFYENTVSPRHFMVEAGAIDYNDIKNNIVKVNVPKDFDFESIDSLKLKIGESAPKELSFTFSEDPEIEIDDDIDIGQNDDKLDLLDATFRFIDKLKVEEYEDDVKDRIKGLFEKFGVKA